MAYLDLFIDTLRRVPHIWHTPKFHAKLLKPVAQLKRELFYARQLGPLTAAVAAHGVTNVWQGVEVIPLADSDEIHFAWITPPDFDFKSPIMIRWLLLPDNNTSAGTLTVTYDTLDLGATHAGSTIAADGATTMTTTVAAVVAADTTASIPFFSQTASIEGLTTDFDILFLKLVASSMSAADRLRVHSLEIYYYPLTS